MDDRIYERRFELVHDLITGHGLEIGAGTRPQRLPDGATCVYFDRLDRDGFSSLFGTAPDYAIRPMDEIPSVFPDGADFLIAHNVLEHCASPITTLIGWLAFVRDGGLVVLSIPAKEHCPGDAGRLVPPPEHLIADFLLADPEDAFESREHIYSFLLGWRDQIHPQTSKDVYAAHCLSEARRSGHDLHWHALDHDAASFVVEAAALLSGRHIQWVRVASAEDPVHWTFGESIFAFRVTHHPLVVPSPALEKTRGRLVAFASVLRRNAAALEGKLGRALVSSAIPWRLDEAGRPESPCRPRALRAVHLVSQ